MMPLLRFCCSVYDYSLRFYPRTLRENFGAEMSEVFRQQTLDAWAEGGWPMLLAVVWCGTKELFAEALCTRMRSHAAIVGAGSFVGTLATFLCLLWSLENPLAVKALEDRLHQVVWESGGTARVIGMHSVRVRR